MKQHYWTHNVCFEDIALFCVRFFPPCCWLFCCTWWTIVHAEQRCHSTRINCVMSMRAAANSWCVWRQFGKMCCDMLQKMNSWLLKMQGTEGTHMGSGMGKGLLFPLYHPSLGKLFNSSVKDTEPIKAAGQEPEKHQIGPAGKSREFISTQSSCKSCGLFSCAVSSCP